MGTLLKWLFGLIIVLVLLIVAFPVAVMLAWAYDLTPDGLKRTAPRSESASDSAPAEPIVASSEPVRASVAVLPFVNMSGNPENEYFSDGVAEEILNLLERINREGTTIVMVTHDPDLAARAHRNIHILDGRASDQELPHAAVVTELEARREAAHV